MEWYANLACRPSGHYWDYYPGALFFLVKSPYVLWSWFNIKMTSYQYRKSHCGDKTILRPSYIHNGISNAGKMTSWYWIRVLVPIDSIYGYPIFKGIAVAWQCWSSTTRTLPQQWPPGDRPDLSPMIYSRYFSIWSIYVPVYFQVSGWCTATLSTTPCMVWPSSFSQARPGRCGLLHHEWPAVGTSNF